MAVKLSTALRNARGSGASLRQIFEDAVIRIYSGTAPASADEAEGTLLVQISKASGTVSAGEVSTAKEAKITVSGHTTDTLTETVTINASGVAEVYSYVNVNGDSDIVIAAALAKAIDKSPVVGAHASGTAVIYIYSKIKGLTFTIAISGTGVALMTLVDNTVANSQCDALKLGPAAAGIISKTSDVWSGLISAGGVAGYFRMVTSTDDGSADSGFIYPRIQGNVATSGQEMTISSTTLVLGATQTIDVATITEPAA